MIFTPESIAAIISAVAAVLGVCVTYLKTKKLKFFDAYFEKKTKAYSDYIKIIISVVNQEGKYSVMDLEAALYVAKLYCSEEAYSRLDEVIHKAWGDIDSDVDSDSNKLLTALNETILIFRQDIQKCRKYKFI